MYVGYTTPDLAFSSQLGVLAIGEICIGAAARPLLEAVLEAGGILEIPARSEGAELLLGGEVDDPVVVLLKVHQDARHSLSRLLGSAADKAREGERIRHLADNLGAIRALKLGVDAARGSDGGNQRCHDQNGFGGRSLFFHALSLGE